MRRMTVFGAKYGPKVSITRLEAHGESVGRNDFVRLVNLLRMRGELISNWITADGFVFVTSEGLAFNVKD